MCFAIAALKRIWFIIFMSEILCNLVNIDFIVIALLWMHSKNNKIQILIENMAANMATITFV